LAIIPGTEERRWNLVGPAIVLTRALHLLPPETAHRLAIWGLAHRLVPGSSPDRWPRLATRLCGLNLPNPLGLAAGFDKNAEALPGLARLGFGFIEIGTVTPRPQAGNPKPRMFRLPADKALINRLGFNSQGLAQVRARLADRDPGWGVIGANIGVNRDAKDPIEDYVAGLNGLYDLVDYTTVNVSSPNTPGLRDLQRRAHLGTLLGALVDTRSRLAGPARPKPILVKIAPDLEPDDERAIAEVAIDAGIEGLIVGNTTVARAASLVSRHRHEAGGLSGAPLLAPSTAQLRRLYHLTAGRLPLVGVGGIACGADAYAKIRAGASAVQLYTSFIYQGPRVVDRVLAELDALLARDGYSDLRAAVGTGT
jgi:dihydroorotate dehydrogenase